MAQERKRKPAPPRRNPADAKSTSAVGMASTDPGQVQRARLDSLTDTARHDLEELLVPHALPAARRGHGGSPVAFVDIPLLALDILCWAIADQLRRAGASTGSPVNRDIVSSAEAVRSAGALLDQRISELRAEYTRRGSLPKNPYELSGVDATDELVRLGFPPAAAGQLVLVLLPHLTESVRHLAEGARRA